MKHEMARSLFLRQSPSDFGCSASIGFLPAWNIQKSRPSLLGKTGVWDEMCVLLPRILVSGRVREFIESLPPYPLEKLPYQHEPAWWIALRDVSFLAHAYVWGAPSKVQAIPRVLAIPWCAIARRLLVPPSLAYASYALHNWDLLDRSKPITLDNIAICNTFDGGSDEAWFIMIHVAIEALAGQAIHALWIANKAVCDNSEDSESDVHNCLSVAHKVMLQINDVLCHMPEKCDPYMYYHRARPYIHGWKNNPTYPDGMVYEGFYNNQPQKLNGETGAQSSVIPALDAFLGVEHDQKDMLGVYLQEMRQFMPVWHRMFLFRLEQYKSLLRDYVIAHPALWNMYNECVVVLCSFRNIHFSYASRYIMEQSQKVEGNPTGVGTGGTPFSAYLKAHSEDTLKALIG